MINDRGWWVALAVCGALVAATPVAVAQSSPCFATRVWRQSPDSAWWTGPMLANSAATLPHGHALVETYLFDVRQSASFDADGARQRTPRSSTYGVLTYAIYGLADRLSVGLVPSATYTRVAEGTSSSGPRVGDLQVMAQYRLASENRCGAMPTLSLNIQETLPTGRYDELGSRTADGVGSGAYTTAISLYSQKSFWLPNGRIVRMRLNVTQAVSRAVHVSGASVYGTPSDFDGRAAPGAVSTGNAAWEYSATMHWVLALDATYRRAWSTRVHGVRVAAPAGSASSVVTLSSGPSDAYGLAPAVEYSWSSSAGVLLGARIIAAGRNTGATITPAVAINLVR